MQRGVRFRAYPTSEQKRILSQWMGASRFVYNAKCSDDTYYRAFLRASLQHTGERVPVDQTYAQYRTELTPWMREVPAQVFRNAAVRWYGAYQRFFAGLGGRPRFKTKAGKQSVWLTRELFAFEQRLDPTTGKRRRCLSIGTSTRPLGLLAFDAHRPFEEPNSVTISRVAGAYFVSFSYEDARAEPPTDAELFERYAALDDALLKEMTTGLDRNVVAPVHASTGEVFDFTPEEKEALARLDGRVGREQRRLARQKEGSHRREQTRQKMARAQARRANIRRDRSHKITRALADSPARVFGIEALGVKAMTARPKARKNPDGRWARNGARAKAGLNRAILGACWGLIATFLGYKARALEKLVLPVAAFNSSRECARCGFTHADNRPTQSVFACGNEVCGHCANADFNASEVVAKRAVARLLAGDMPARFTRGTRGRARGACISRREATRPSAQRRKAVA